MKSTSETDTEIAALVSEALSKAVGTEGAPGVQIRLEEPRDRKHGDRSTPDLLALAKKLGRNPRELAGQVVAALPAANALWNKVEIAGPGL